MKLLIKINLILAAIVVILALLLPFEIGFSIISGYFIAFLFVLSAAWIHNKFFKIDENRFIKLFYRSFFLRLLLVVIVLTIFLSLSKINEIYFTVSFLISYIYNSVAEMILFNKILSKKSKIKK